MAFVGLQISAPTFAFVLRTTVGFLACARIAILIAAALRLAIAAMVFVGLKIPAPAFAFILRTAIGFLACAIAAIFIGIARRLAIPAMGVVGLKISAPALAFVLRACVLLAFFRIIRAATKQGSRNQYRENAQNAVG
jgi:hypothetical protein